MTNSYFRTLLVIGDNPEEQLEKFNKSKKVEPYILYRYNDIPNLKQKSLEFYNSILAKATELQLSEMQIHAIDKEMQELVGMSDIDYYNSLKEWHTTNEQGDIISINNPQGKWMSYRKYNLFTNLKGEKSNSFLKGDIQWDKIHKGNAHTFERVWEMIIDGDEPKDHNDKIIYGNMVDKKDYLLSFQTKENYVAYNSAFWCYAIVLNGKWIDIDENSNNDSSWVTLFYTDYISNLNDSTMVSIFEFTV